MSVLTVLGAICGQEAVAPLAGQPRPAGSSGSGHVNPNVSHPDQLPQHQTDHSCVTRQEQAHNLCCIRGNGLNLSVPFKHELIYRADSGPHSVFVWVRSHQVRSPGRKSPCHLQEDRFTGDYCPGAYCTRWFMCVWWVEKDRRQPLLTDVSPGILSFLSYCDHIIKQLSGYSGIRIILQDLQQDASAAPVFVLLRASWNFSHWWSGRLLKFSEGRWVVCLNERLKMMRHKLRMAHKSSPIWNGLQYYLLRELKRYINSFFSTRGGFFFKLLILLSCFTKKPLSLYCVGCPKSYFVLCLFVNTETLWKGSVLFTPLKQSKK